MFSAGLLKVSDRFYLRLLALLIIHLMTLNDEISPKAI